VSLLSLSVTVHSPDQSARRPHS